MNALLMKEGAQDLRSGQQFNHTVFFGENVDIHHIFPKAWCEKQKIKPEVYDCIINKTPLSYRTNRIIGGVSPSEYIGKLEAGDRNTPSIAPENLDGYLNSHLIDPALIRADDFEKFMAARQLRLLSLIEKATGQSVYRGEEPDPDGNDEVDEEASEAKLTMA